MWFFTPGEGKNVVPLRTRSPRRSEINIGHHHYRRLKIIQKYPVPSRCPSLLRKIHFHADAVDTQWVNQFVRADAIMEAFTVYSPCIINSPTDLTKYYVSFCKEYSVSVFYAMKIGHYQIEMFAV